MKIRKTVIPPDPARGACRSKPWSTAMASKSPSCASSSKEPCASVSKKSPSWFSPGDEIRYARVASDHAGRLRFVPQPEPLGYGDAVLCARDFVGQDPFLHLVGDRLYISRTEKGCAQHLVEVAEAQACAVSAVQATRCWSLSRYGKDYAERLPIPERKRFSARALAVPDHDGAVRRDTVQFDQSDPLVGRSPGVRRLGRAGHPLLVAITVREGLRGTAPNSRTVIATN